MSVVVSSCCSFHMADVPQQQYLLMHRTSRFQFRIHLNALSGSCTGQRVPVKLKKFFCSCCISPHLLHGPQTANVLECIIQLQNMQDLMEKNTPPQRYTQSRTTTYFKVLLQYVSVQQSIFTPRYQVLLRTARYYSSTTPYDKMLFLTLQYYSVLQTIASCSSLFLYYKVKPRTQYYNVLLRTSKLYKVLHTTTPYQKVRH